MDKYAILLSYFDKQSGLINKLHRELININLSPYSEKFVFAMRTQQFYTAIEDLFKQVAKAFENHVEDLSSYHKGLLLRMNMEINKIRPAVISKESFLLLDKVRAFRHFIRHAYDCELDEDQLKGIQSLLKNQFQIVFTDLRHFREYIETLS